ncbi:methylated-DNA--[protein]-cysteine S-methyltransferase [Cohnella terricola]|uniref:methylated-DNA--[protein]-cysteine S-methyltransferase n=1 Tax=Cohnella terricola TaxID=1289167 RepID=A0A559JFQ2_9BACL|nr:methylated-DNA--[protein]-cysteine S-methyltransferase [Cohnella terricola]TVX98696.1 methylated-DNA--[protein]-cysteine S-methyltransferase [Cohnella terricola]
MTRPAKTQVYWSLIEHGDWYMHIAATVDGLCFVGSRNHPLEEMTAWIEARLPGSAVVRDDEMLHPYAAELIQYLQGARERFTVPFDLRGTPFQLAVWEALGAVPYGATRSYSDIANAIRKPAAVRAVGSAIGANPLLITVPCHRVVGKNGTLTGYRGGLEMKKKLLELETSGASTEGTGT